MALDNVCMAAPVVLTRIVDPLCRPMTAAQSEATSKGSRTSDLNAGSFSQSPLTIQQTELMSITVWTQNLHERLLGRLEISHRFINKRIFVLLESFDQSKETGATMSAGIESIVRRRMSSLPSDLKITTKEEERTLETVWSEIKSYLG